MSQHLKFTLVELLYFQRIFFPNNFEELFNECAKGTKFENFGCYHSNSFFKTHNGNVLSYLNEYPLSSIDIQTIFSNMIETYLNDRADLREKINNYKNNE